MSLAPRVGRTAALIKSVYAVYKTAWPKMGQSTVGPERKVPPVVDRSFDPRFIFTSLLYLFQALGLVGSFLGKTVCVWEEMSGRVRECMDGKPIR